MCWHISDATEEGQALADEARRILKLAGREDADSVTLADVQARMASLNAMPFNGDGVLNPAALTDQPELAALASRIMDSYGSVTGCDGQPGLGRAQLDNFFTDVQAIASWHAQAQTNTCSLPSQEQAVAAASALNAVQAKVEDFFARAHLAAFDAKAQQALSPTAEGYAALGTQVLTQQDAAIAALPLAQFTADAVLPLRQGINPAWAQAMEEFRRTVVQPLLGDVDSLQVEQWNAVKAQLSACQAWLAAYPQTPLGHLGAEEAQALLNSGLQEQLQQLIERDEAEQQHSQRVVALEKLIRFQRDLLALLNNFVNFAHFYRREGAAFQSGTLYLDDRPRRTRHTGGHGQGLSGVLRVPP